MPRRVPAGVVLLLLSLAGRLHAGPARPPSADALRFFEPQVRPRLQAHCVACHGGGKVRSGLDLTCRETFLRGGTRGPAVSLDRPDESLLLRAVNHQDLKMPPKGKLAAAPLETLTRWVRM